MPGVDDRDLVILVPMLGRPHHVAPLLESIREATPRARVLFLLTDRADQQDVADAIGSAMARSWIGGPGLRIQALSFGWRERGDYAAKINAGVAATSETLVFTGASDIRFEPGWFEAAVKHFENPRTGVVGTNDVHARRSGTHATHFLVHRRYVDVFGPLWPECYIHEYGDDELEGLAAKRNAYVLEAAARVPHEHPLWGRGDWDDTYRDMGRRQTADRDLFAQRRRLWT